MPTITIPTDFQSLENFLPHGVAILNNQLVKVYSQTEEYPDHPALVVWDDFGKYTLVKADDIAVMDFFVPVSMIHDAVTLTPLAPEKSPMEEALNDTLAEGVIDSLTAPLKITGDLPLFRGYYHSMFDLGDQYIENEADSLADYLRGEHPDHAADITEEFVSDYLADLDYRPAYLSLSQSIVIAFEALAEANDIPVTVKFKKLRSPREYNFATDQIETEFTLSADYLIEMITDDRYYQFERFIEEQFTPRDGFIPYYSNDAAEWVERVREVCEDSDEEFEHAEVTVLLDFIFRVVHDLEPIDLLNEGDGMACNFREDFDNEVPVDHEDLLTLWEERDQD